MSLIVEGLYLSNLKTSRNHKFFKTQKISDVLIAAKTLKMIFKEVHYKRLILDDNPKQNIAKYFAESIKFIQDSISQKRNILVHCLGGKSRSVTIVVAYVMLKQNQTFEKALEFVKTQHRPSNPNPGFLNQLRMFEQCVVEYYQLLPQDFQGDFDYDLLEKLLRQHIKLDKKKKFLKKEDTIVSMKMEKSSDVGPETVLKLEEGKIEIIDKISEDHKEIGQGVEKIQSE